MRIGVLGGGSVGQTLGAGFARLGHDVVVGIREVTADTLARPRAQARPLAETGLRVVTLEEAARHGEVVVNATSGEGTLAALARAGAGTLAGKVLIDVSNALDFSQGMPPFIPAAYAGPTSLGEQVQAAFPEARVVKAFNTVTAAVMVEPGLVAGEHDLFLSGNDPEAKAVVEGLARGFGWTRFTDLGDIRGCRAQEVFVLIFVRLYMTSGSGILGYRIVR